MEAFSVLSIIYLYLLLGSWHDKRTRRGVEVENFDDKTIITYKPGKHGPIAAMSIHPLYINIVLFMATISVGLIFMLAAAERSEWFQNFLNLPMPRIMQILFYKAFWVESHNSLRTVVVPRDRQFPASQAAQNCRDV